FDFQLFPAGAGQRIELRPPRIVGVAPFGVDPSGALQSLKCCEKRTWVDFENAARNLLNPARNPETMHGFEAECFENEHVERALDNVGLGGVHRGEIMSCSS